MTDGTLAAFIKALAKADLPAPEVFWNTDGECFDLDWTAKKYHSLGLLLDDDRNRLPFACINGEGNSWHGVATFDGVDVPLEIAAALRRIYGEPDA
jgi:hypothetical protein